ncbi:hypothetical protein BCR42DRAFT_154072 [Absidia repens]|uniref:EF-hand domain-containing protein n=1 Tax=Absidia repens TaxID=90262 RepID=A0A1X2I168_9FUNG|nr:hypothetical protein BCR42DRAFT_154072 [Absidia repens]
MVLKSSILACALAGVAITQALPMSGNKATIDKRHKNKPLPTAPPSAAGFTPDQQFVACLVNTLYNPPKDKDDRLDYEELINGCIEVVYKTKPAPAPAAASGASEQAGPGQPVEQPLPDPATDVQTDTASSDAGPGQSENPLPAAAQNAPPSGTGSGQPQEPTPGTNNPTGSTGSTFGKDNDGFDTPAPGRATIPEDHNRNTSHKPEKKD